MNKTSSSILSVTYLKKKSHNMTMKIKPGDSVKVKDGVKDPDSEDIELSSWQGRIIEIDEVADHNGNIRITIEWDSLTLTQMPAEFIQQSEIDGLDWKTMVLYESDLNKADARDRKFDVKKTQGLLSEQHYWDSFGKSGIRISNVLEGLNPKDEMKCLRAWDQYLERELSFPIQAIVSESADNWIINSGDIVQITLLSEIVDMYGILATIRLNQKSFEYPLCDLEVMDKKAKNHQLIQDYCVWFANR